MSTRLLVGAYQQPRLAEDPSIAAIPGGATLAMVTAAAAYDGTVYAVVTADVSLSVTLSVGAANVTRTGSAVALSLPCALGALVQLTAQANSGPSFVVSGSVNLQPASPVGLADLGSIFDAPGELIVSIAAGVAGILTPGPNLDVLTIVGGVPVWATIGAQFGAAGQLIAGTGAGAGELLAKGGAGTVLTVGGADPSGLEWIAPPTPASYFTAAGQLIVGTGNGTGELLAIGAAGTVLTVGGADPSGLEWITPGGASAPATLPLLVLVDTTDHVWTISALPQASFFASPAIQFLGITWASSLGLFLAVCTTGIYSSPDLHTWTLRQSTANSMNAVGWSGALAVAVGNAGLLYTSPDGITWTSRTSGIATSIWQIAWSPTLSLWCYGAAAGAMRTSPNGITWTSRTSGTANDIRGLIWSRQFSKFMLVDAVTALPRWSSNGTAWSAFTGSSPGADTCLAEYPLGVAFIGANGTGCVTLDGTSVGNTFISPSGSGTTTTAMFSPLLQALVWVVGTAVYYAAPAGVAGTIGIPAAFAASVQGACLCYGELPASNFVYNGSGNG